jgi:peptide chain release factor 1
MYAKLDEILARYRDIERQLADPAAAPDGARLARLAKEHGSLAKVAKPYQEFLKLQQEIATAEDLLRQADNDPDMRGYAQEELGKLKQREQELITRLEDLLLLDPEEDYDSVIMEIRAGTGGEEAALFARDLYEMYTRYARDQGWTVEELDCHPTDLGGFKEVSFSVSGEGVYRHLRYESGGHRVQRVPKTETQGRIHTSAATVAVLPEPTEIQVEIRPEDVRVDTFCSGGPGGQHQNKTQSGVRLTHLPTGTVAECRSERSQHKNKAQAWRMLRSRLYEALLTKQQAERAAERRCQIGSGDRSERIRTYNFPQNRVTDHRINLNLYQLDSILMGDLGGLIRHLMEYDKRQRLGQLSRPEKQLA